MERMQIQIGDCGSRSLLGRESDRTPLYPVIVDTKDDIREVPLTKIEFYLLQIFLDNGGYFDNIVLKKCGFSPEGRDGTITNSLIKIQKAIPELVIKQYGHFVPGHYLDGEYIHRTELIESVFKNNPNCFYQTKQFQLRDYEIRTIIPKEPYLFAPRNVQGKIIPILNISCGNTSFFADTTPLGLRSMIHLATSNGSVKFYGLVNSLYKRIPYDERARKRNDVRNSYNLAVKLIRLAAGEKESEVIIPERTNRKRETDDKEVIFPKWI